MLLSVAFLGFVMFVAVVSLSRHDLLYGHIADDSDGDIVHGRVHREPILQPA